MQSLLVVVAFPVFIDAYKNRLDGNILSENLKIDFTIFLTVFDYTGEKRRK